MWTLVQEGFPPNGWQSKRKRRATPLETYRLKNIAILILLLLNGGLLLLLGYQFLQAKRTEEAAAAQLNVLCQANELSLSGQVDLEQQPLSPLALSRDTQTETAIAAWLLGGGAAAASQGGGIYSYETENGTIQFRSGGGFDGGRLSLEVEDIAGFSYQFFKQFGYKNPQIQTDSLSGTAVAVQEVADVPVYGCDVTLRFDNGTLVSVTGAHVSLENAVVEAGPGMTCVTALVRFLDYRNASGVVCSEIRNVRCVYELQSTASSLRLLPAWRIDTDTYTYFVDCSSGEVTRK